MKLPLLALCCAVATAASAALPPYVLPNSEMRALPVNAAGRHYLLHIGLPGNYAKQPNKRYPVVYVTDAYWDFVKITAFEGSLVYDKVVPEFITVGLGYVGDHLDYGDLRRWELSPVPFGDGGPEKSGHAADFLKTIETEIIPLIEREYRADPAHRILAGASLGGLFTLYTMYTKPDLFSGYIAATPAVVLGNDWLFGYENDFVKAGRTLKARLFMAGGANESPGFLGGIRRFDQLIVSRKYPELAYQFREIENERHAGMQHEAYVRGLQFVFAPLAPESGPSK